MSSIETNRRTPRSEGAFPSATWAAPTKPRRPRSAVLHGWRRSGSRQQQGDYTASSSIRWPGTVDRNQQSQIEGAKHLCPTRASTYSGESSTQRDRPTHLQPQQRTKANTHRTHNRRSGARRQLAGCHPTDGASRASGLPYCEHKLSPRAHSSRAAPAKPRPRETPCRMQDHVNLTRRRCPRVTRAHGNTCCNIIR